MRLRVDRVKQLMAAGGVDAPTLASAIERPALKGDRSAKALNNWLAGRDHPRCKAADIRQIAAALGVSLPEVARFTSMVRFHRGSTQKARLVADMVRGKAVDEALNTLAFSGKRAATNVQKALSAAIADAEVNDADITQLVVSESSVDEGPHIKRFRPKDRGRAHQILKQTSHITVTVETRVELADDDAGSFDANFDASSVAAVGDSPTVAPAADEPNESSAAETGASETPAAEEPKGETEEGKAN